MTIYAEYRTLYLYTRYKIDIDNKNNLFYEIENFEILENNGGKTVFDSNKNDFLRIKDLKKIEIVLRNIISCALYNHKQPKLYIKFFKLEIISPSCM